MKLLKSALLWFAVLALLCVVSIGFTLYVGWPLWSAAAVACAVIALYFAIRFARRLWILRRTRSRLTEPVEAHGSRSNEALSSKALLTQNWKRAIATLRGSCLKSSGNPLYVLPWYMVVGRSGTGKTTALTRARLSSPIQKVSQIADIPQTANCDWWYFDDAVVIDCAGRYVDSDDNEQDHREWNHLLDLLARYRAREGLNGVVLAVSTERLLSADTDALIEEGRIFRARIEQLIHLFSKRFPIYLLITQCDRLYGFEEWAHELPSDALGQAMGYLSQEDGNGTNTRFLDHAFESIDERLQKLRLAIIARSSAASPAALIFPNELHSLKSKLSVWLNTCFHDDAYLERPFLRGLFFSSALQEGGAASVLMNQALPRLPAHPKENAGLFLHDFFSRVLPRDRDAALPARIGNRWQQITRNIGVLAWLMACVAAAILLTASFTFDLHSISLAKKILHPDPALNGRIENDAAVLASESDLLERFVKGRDNWLSHWLVIGSHTGELQTRLTQQFLGEVRKRVLPVAYQDNQGEFAPQPGISGDQETARQIVREVRQINLLKARLQGASRDELLTLAQPPVIASYSPQLDRQIERLVISQLAWSSQSDSALRDRLSIEQANLARLAYADPKMPWLAQVPAQIGSVAPVSAYDFWNAGTPPDSAQTDGIVPAAFTNAGDKTIDSFLSEMQASVTDQAQFLSHRSEFKQWYRAQRMRAWQKFVDDFIATAPPLKGAQEWRLALSRVASMQSPYYQLIDRLDDEFAQYDNSALPSWLRLSREFQKLREQGAQYSKRNSALKVTDALDSVGNKAVKEVLSGELAQGRGTVANYMAAADTLRQYFSNVRKLSSDGASGIDHAYQIAAAFHQSAVPVSGASASGAQAAWQSLETLKSQLPFDNAADMGIWKVIAGPLNFVLDYVDQQASCQLQKDWQANVLWPLQSAPDKTEMISQLYGQKGSIWTFVDGSAKPFITRDAKRFQIVETNGHSLPFTDSFLPLLNRAANQRLVQQLTQQQRNAEKQGLQLRVQQRQTELDKQIAQAKQSTDALMSRSVPLTMTAQPTGVNTDAKAKPFETALTIQCASGAQTLNNYNFSVSTNFAWSPNQCGEVNLQIKIDKLVLTKKYPGALAVARFLADFRNGTHQFSAEDFPASQAALAVLGVRQITVRYAFDGQDEVLKLAQQLDDNAKLQQNADDEKQRLQDAQLQQAQQELQPALMAGSMQGLPSGDLASLALPQQIGVCWDSQSTGNYTGSADAGVGLAASADNGEVPPLPPFVPTLPPLPVASIDTVGTRSPAR
jgi:type VI secretion system protein ImpL